MKFRFREREPLEELTDYMEEMKNKPLPERKALWWSLMTKDGIHMAAEIGDRLNVEESVVSQWIRDWIQSRQRPVGTDIPATHAFNSVAVSEVNPGDLSSGEKSHLRV